MPSTTRKRTATPSRRPAATARKAAPTPSDAIPPFRGFGRGALSFFEELAAQQSREWFLANKETFEADVRGPMTALINELNAEFERRRLPIAADPRRAMFRLNRDIRFSKDKSPYKTHAGAVMRRAGAGDASGMLYLHVAPEGSFMAAGFFQPEPDALESMRRALVKQAKAFATVEAGLKKSGLAVKGHGDSLKRLPRGFEAVSDERLGALLRQKSFLIERKIAPAALRDPKLVAAIADFATSAWPFLEFGHKAMSG
jgi:uncharacterized protein (TIGR02453 family)